MRKIITLNNNFCIEFIDFMLAGKTLDFANLSSPNNFQKHDDVI